MTYPLRWFLPGVLYEITTRTIQERFLLRPGHRSRELIVGVIGRAQELYPAVQLHAFSYMSNHAHLLLSSSDGEQLALFLGFVNGQVARVMGRLHDWRGPFWGRRFRPIPALDAPSMIARLRYVMAQGVKEGLVASPRDWPGASSTPGLLADMAVVGTWIDRDAETRARRRGGPVEPRAFEKVYIVVLTPIPPWAGLHRAELVARHRALLEDIERAARGAPILGAEAVLSAHPHARPEAPARSRAPLCHASTTFLRRAFRRLYADMVATYRAAAAALRAGAPREACGFPEGSFPPRLPYVGPVDPGALPWAFAVPTTADPTGALA